MNLIIMNDDVRYMDKGILYKKLTNISKDEKYITDIAIKVSGIKTAIYSDAFDILGRKNPDNLGVYMTMEEYLSDKRENEIGFVDKFLASCIVSRDELKEIKNIEN